MRPSPPRSLSTQRSNRQAQDLRSGICRLAPNESTAAPASIPVHRAEFQRLQREPGAASAQLERDKRNYEMADETSVPSTPQSAPEARPYTPRPAYAGPGGPRPPRPAGGPGGPGGPGGGPGGRKFFRRKKVCKFCTEKIDAISYRD